MKTKRQNHHKGWKQALGVLLVFALAAGLVLSVPALSGVAYAAPILQEEGDGDKDVAPASNNKLDWSMSGDEKSSVTVKFPEDMTGGLPEDLKALVEKGVTADLYLFAPAVRLSGYDVYAYCVDDGMPYYGLVETYLKASPDAWTVQTVQQQPDGYERPDWATGTPGNYLIFRYTPKYLDDLSDDANNELYVGEQVGLAELMAKVILAPQLVTGLDQEKAQQIKAQSSGAINKQQTELPFGLYLNVVHGEYIGENGGYLKPEDSIVLVDAESDPEAAQTAGSKVCTIAYSDTKVYTFQPQLLSLPTRSDLNTMGPGTWSYDMTVYAKKSDEDRHADLILEKDLTNFVAGKPVTFVFRVSAYTDHGTDDEKLAYEKVVSLVFDAAGKQTSDLITNRIPAGSTVVITEEYSGSTYHFDGATAKLEGNKEMQGEKPEFVYSDETPNSIIITNIPAGRVHLTVPGQTGQAGEKVLEDGTTETVTFTNSGDSTNNGGGAVLNSFEQSANNGWTWSQYSYNAETGTWNVTNTGSGTVPAAPAEEEG